MKKILLLIACACAAGVACHGGDAPDIAPPRIPPPTLHEQIRQRLQPHANGPQIRQDPSPGGHYKSEHQMKAERKWKEFRGKVNEDLWGWNPIDYEN